MILRHGGKRYDIQNWDEFSEKLLWAIGFQVVKGIDDEIHRQNLMGATAQLFGSYKAEANKTELIIESDAPHAVYIEYGTAGRRKGVTDPYGELNQAPNINRKMPAEKVSGEWQVIKELQDWAKIKGIPKEAYWALAKHIQEYGMEPRAPLRRVLYNQNRMAGIINRAVKSATR